MVHTLFLTDSRKFNPTKYTTYTVLVRLKLGLLEEDFAFRFQKSQPTVSQIFTTWVNFLYHQVSRFLYDIDIVSSNMPAVFK